MGWNQDGILIRPRVVQDGYGLPDAERSDQIRSYDGMDDDAEEY